MKYSGNRSLGQGCLKKKKKTNVYCQFSLQLPEEKGPSEIPLRSPG